MRILLKVLSLGLALHIMECSAQTVSGQTGGYNYVDLGLPSGTKWATCNVGATQPAEFGTYYAWGETSPKKDYSWDSYKWCKNKELDKYGDPLDFTKYVTDSIQGSVDNKTVLEPEDDAATVYLGDKWRTPTESEMKELKNGCNWTWTNDYNGTNVAGMIGTSKTNGRTIFLPADESRDDEIHTTTFHFGKYLTASLHPKQSLVTSYLLIEKDEIGIGIDNRCYGRTVRAVVK
ncbi:MAG: hypothetical protein IKP81_14305 [Paludibacteraceae bacterium]|nr:hypothetical protein [Paludibacteraceae bacterium]